MSGSNRPGRGRLGRILAAQQRTGPAPKDDRPEAPYIGTNSESPLVYKPRLAALPKPFMSYAWKKGQTGNVAGSSAKARLRAADKRRAKRMARETAKIARDTAKTDKSRRGKTNDPSE